MLQFSPSLDSVSSNLMSDVTLDRNEHGIRPKFIGQLGYGLISVAAVVETVVSGVFILASLLFYPCNPEYTFNALEWFSSSSFSILWSFTDFILNPFVDKLVPDEKGAREIFYSVNRILNGALI